MPSPFPGMDPFLEGRYWPDFHDRLINSLSEVIAEQLPAGYDTQIRERVYPARRIPSAVCCTLTRGKLF